MNIDAFLYNGEVDMLECHIRQTAAWADVHIALERDHTNTGAERAIMTLPSHLYGLSKRLVHVPELGGGPSNAWEFEDQSRALLMKAVANYAESGDDIVVFGDVDEIPPSLLSTQPGHGCYVLAMEHHIFNLLWRDPEAWLGPFVGMLDHYDPAEKLGQMRRARGEFPRRHGGWHLSWFGSMDERRAKVMNSPHTDYQWMAEPGVLEAMVETGTIWNDKQLVPVTDPLLVPMPKWCRDNECPDDWWARA